MAGSRVGGLKAAATNKTKFGVDYYAQIGALGGKATSEYPRGFAAMSPEQRFVISRKGGIKSRRGKAKPVVKKNVLARFFDSLRKV